MGDIVAVASVVYNLAGDEALRPDYLQTLVVHNVLSGTKNSMGDSIVGGLLRGPGIKLRQFYRWAQNPVNFGTVGMPTGALEVRGSLNPTDVVPFVPHDPGMVVWAQTAYVEDGDAKYWAEQWIFANRPEDIGTAWIVDYNDVLNQIEITFADDTTQIVATPDLDYLSRYVYVYYAVVTEDVVGSTITGDLVDLAPGAPFPTTAGWTLLSTVPGPPIHRTYERVTAVDDGEIIGTLTETMHQFEDGTDFSYRIDTQTTVHQAFSTTQLFIYKVGSGIPELDALVTTGASYGEFFPFIPFRINDKFISGTYHPTVYPQIKKAFKKSIDGKLDDLIAQLADNESIGDIDHACVQFGVSLNVIEPAGMKYIYAFLESLQQAQAGGVAAYDDYVAASAAYTIAQAAWTAWRDHPVGPQPPQPSMPSPLTNLIKIRGTGDVGYRFNIQLRWNYITDGVGIGLAKPGAKSGDIWLEHTRTVEHFRTSTISGHDGNIRTIKVKIGETQYMRIYWQRTATTYTYIETVGLVHRNYVYQGHYVEIDTKQALADTEESPFIIPLHFETWRQLPLAVTSQMATACVFCVFNCFEIHKEKWYEKGIFKILLVVVIAVVSVAFTGGAGLGLLGTNFFVGSAIGFTGLTAAIVGAVVNALAALVLATILQAVTKGLGILGQILSAVIMIMIGSVGAAFRSTGSLAINWGDLLRVDNLMKLTDAVGNGIGDMLRADSLQMQEDWLDYAEKAKKESEKIQQAYFKNFGYGGGLIDPLMFTDTKSLVAESSDTFLTRTLMTGSEIAEMSQELLYGFPEYSLKLPDAFT